MNLNDLIFHFLTQIVEERKKFCIQELKEKVLLLHLVPHISENVNSLIAF